MNHFIIFAVTCVAAFAAPEGYGHRESPSVIEHFHAKDFQPGSANGLPCIHATHTPSDLILLQSNERILNQQNLPTAASDFKLQSEAVTSNSHFVVGGGGSAASATPGGAQEFQAGQGYSHGHMVTLQPLLPPIQEPTRPHFNMLPPLPSQLPAPNFVPGNLDTAKVVSPEVASGVSQGYVYNQGGLFSQGSHVHQHYTNPKQYFNPGVVINGFGKMPPPGTQFLHGHTSASGSNNFDYSKTGHGAVVQGTTASNASPPFRSFGPISSSPSGNFIAPHSGEGYVNRFQHASNTIAGSSSHATQSGASSLASFGLSSLEASVPSGHSLTSSFNSGGSLFSQLPNGHTLSGSLGHVIQETVATASLDPSVEKHIYVHVPPEDVEEKPLAKQTVTLNQPKPRKHYKIIFIKAPSTPQPNYAQLAVTPQTEEKTLVYVLVKKPDEPSLEEIQRVQTLEPKQNKPEVYFIKYKDRRENDMQTPVYSGTSNAENSVVGGGYKVGKSYGLETTGGRDSK